MQLTRLAPHYSSLLLTFTDFQLVEFKQDYNKSKQTAAAWQHFPKFWNWQISRSYEVAFLTRFREFLSSGHSALVAITRSLRSETAWFSGHYWRCASVLGALKTPKLQVKVFLRRVNCIFCVHICLHLVWRKFYFWYPGRATWLSKMKSQQSEFNVFASRSDHQISGCVYSECFQGKGNRGPWRRNIQTVSLLRLWRTAQTAENLVRIFASSFICHDTSWSGDSSRLRKLSFCLV